MIKVGTYVKQRVFDRVYRYCVIISCGEHPFFSSDESKNWAQVVFNPRQDYPVASNPYPEYVPTSELEVLSD